MSDVREGLHNQTATGGAANNRPAGTIIDADRGASKVYTDPLPDFSGDAIDFEDWERKVGATIKQTAYKGFLDAAATPGNVVEEARSKELFNMILSCVACGHALNTVERSRMMQVEPNADIAHGKLSRTGTLIQLRRTE